MRYKQNVEVFNATVKAAKTADYTLLTTDQEINVTPAANTTITLPAISTLAAAGFGAKTYLISKEGTGRFNVKIVANSADKINLKGKSQDAIYLSSRGESVALHSDAVSKKWTIGMQNMDKFVGVGLGGRHEANMSIELTGIAAGQYNGVEWNVAGPGAANTPAASTSYCGFRMNYNVTAAAGSVVTARGAFMGLYSHATTDIFVGNCTVLELELGNAAAAGAAVSAVLTLCTRSAKPSASYHDMSAYITIRDYSTGSGGPLPNFLSLLNASLAWTVPATTATALFTTYTHEVTHMGHALKIDVGGTPYWIVCTATAPH